MALEPHHVETIIVIPDSDTSHQWILKPGGEYLMRQDIYKVSKSLPTRDLLIMKGETVTLWERAGRHHLNQMIKANSPVMGQMDSLFPLRGTKHHFCAIPAKRIPGI